MSNETDDTATADNGAAPRPYPETLKEMDALRAQVRESFGQVLIALMNLPRCRHQSLTDITDRVLAPFYPRPDRHCGPRALCVGATSHSRS